MDDRIRVSDADRERVTARLREHYADGRLTSEEFEERLTVVLNATTFGDLRRVMADLPDGAPVPPQVRSGPPGAWRGGPIVIRRGPRLLPLLGIVLIAALVLPGAGWLFFAVFKVVLVLWLVACVAGIFAVARFRRHMRRYWQPGPRPAWRHDQRHTW
jgi:hypothetical protein